MAHAAFTRATVTNTSAEGRTPDSNRPPPLSLPLTMFPYGLSAFSDVQACRGDNAMLAPASPERHDTLKMAHHRSDVHASQTRTDSRCPHRAPCAACTSAEVNANEQQEQTKKKKCSGEDAPSTCVAVRRRRRRTSTLRPPQHVHARPIQPADATPPESLLFSRSSVLHVDARTSIQRRYVQNARQQQGPTRCSIPRTARDDAQHFTPSRLLTPRLPMSKANVPYPARRAVTLPRCSSARRIGVAECRVRNQLRQSIRRRAPSEMFTHTMATSACVAIRGRRTQSNGNTASARQGLKIIAECSIQRERRYGVRQDVMFEC